jgi:diguanylate cyclase (GGDEF)-like protein
LPTDAHALAFVIVLLVSWLGLTPAYAALRVSVNAAVLAAIALVIAADLYRYGRDVVRERHSWLLAVPLVAAAAGFSLRGLRALWGAQSVGPEMITDSNVNLVSAVVYMVIALTFHATLIGLVVGRILIDLRYRSRHDGLTGLLNRRAMEETLPGQMQRSRRTGEPFVVLMLDLDHFKAINDKHGHPAGDEVLRGVAEVLQEALRLHDVPGRYGGEEFGVLLPGSDAAAAEAIAERIRRKVEWASFAGELKVTASVGCAALDANDVFPAAVVARADRALYAAKAAGRNRAMRAAA